jgi:hypothetical protein
VCCKTTARKGYSTYVLNNKETTVSKSEKKRRKSTSNFRVVMGVLGMFLTILGLVTLPLGGVGVLCLVIGLYLMCY